MADILELLHPPQAHYRDRRFEGTQEQFEEVLRNSTTVYIGNLSFCTTEEQIYEVGGCLPAAGLRQGGRAPGTQRCCCPRARRHTPLTPPFPPVPTMPPPGVPKSRRHQAHHHGP